MKTIVMGASTKPDRYSNKAVKMLTDYKHEVVAIGNRQGNIDDIQIIKGKPNISDVHTVTMYLNRSRQTEYFDYIISLNPKRVIFNPGTANPEFEKLLKNNNIEIVNACTLVLLSIGEF